MEKNKQAKLKVTTILIIIFGLLVVGFIIGKTGILFAITGAETMTRTFSATSVNPSSTFTVTYTAVGTSGTWGSSIVDSVSGGCLFPDGTNQLKTVMLSTDGNTKTVTVTAPASGTCTFTGDYKYGTSTTLNFASGSVSVCQRNTDADTNCDGTVSRTELGVVITSWISGSVTRDKLGEAIVAWLG